MDEKGWTVKAEEVEKTEKERLTDVYLDYFPRKGQIDEKGYLAPGMPFLLAYLRMLPDIHPELGEYNEKVSGILEEIERRLISVDGRSRNEFTQILVAQMQRMRELEEEEPEEEKKKLGFFKRWKK